MTVSITSTIVYTTPNCSGCMLTKRILDEHGIPYEVVPLEENPDILEQFKAEGLTTAPIVTAITGVWSGFRPDLIKDLVKAVS